MMETLGIILGSTVLAALISGIVALATSRKQESLQYIKAEMSNELRDC